MTLSSTNRGRRRKNGKGWEPAEEMDQWRLRPLVLTNFFGSDTLLVLKNPLSLKVFCYRLLEDKSLIIDKDLYCLDPFQVNLTMS